MMSKLRFVLGCLILSMPGAAFASGGELLPSSFFAPPGAPIVPGAAIEGTLVIGGDRADLFDLHTNSFRIDRKALQLDMIPPLRVDLVQDGTRIIPVQRGPIRGKHAHWEWIVQPGTA